MWPLLANRGNEHLSVAINAVQNITIKKKHSNSLNTGVMRYRCLLYLIFFALKMVVADKLRRVNDGRN